MPVSWPELPDAYLLFALAVFFLVLYLHQLSFFLISIYTVRKNFHRKIVKSPANSPGVSIVKPLMGVDLYLRENLVSHFTLDYPKFELLLCVQNEDDPVIPMIKSLNSQYPHVDTRLFIGGKDGVINPMVHNMAPAYEAAKYDLVWISTSRIRATTPMLHDMVEKSSDPEVAIVHQLPYYVDHNSFVGALEKVCFGCALARNYIALNQLGVSCVTGMSYVVKKALLDEIGGLAYFGKYLAEDFFLSGRLHSKGYRHILAAFPAQQNVASSTMTAYKARMVRWLRLRLNMVPLVAGVLEPLNECLSVGITASWALSYLFSVNLFLIFSVHLVVWICLDFVLLRAIQNSKLPFSVATFLLAWWTRELLVYVVFIQALLNPRRITWGKYTYKLQLGGLTQRISSAPVSTAITKSNNHLLKHKELFSNLGYVEEEEELTQTTPRPIGYVTQPKQQQVKASTIHPHRITTSPPCFTSQGANSHNRMNHPSSPIDATGRSCSQRATLLLRNPGGAVPLSLET